MRLIDADKLKAHFAWWKGGTREMTMDEAKSDFDCIIDLQPTVDVVPAEDYRSMEQTVYKLTQALAEAEPKHGCNIANGRCGNGQNGDARIFSCSECGYGFNDIYLCNESDYPIEPNYCPNCGAKMDGEE